jgi:hypothetical protein
VVRLRKAVKQQHRRSRSADDDIVVGIADPDAPLDHDQPSSAVIPVSPLKPYATPVA